MFGLDLAQTINTMVIGEIWFGLGPIIITNFILHFRKDKYRFSKEVEAIVDWLFVFLFTVLFITNLMVPGFVWVDTVIFLLVVPFSAYSGWYEVVEVRDSYRKEREAKDLVDAQKTWLADNGHTVWDDEPVSIMIEYKYPGGYSNFVNIYWFDKDFGTATAT